MNPVLLKPGSDRRSHVVVMGQPGRRGRRPRLRRRPAPAGRGRRTRRSTTCPRASTWSSPRARAARRRSTCGRSDYVNMGLARHARCRPSWSATSTAAGCSRRSSAPWRCSTPDDQRAGRGLRGQQVPRRRRPAAARARRAGAAAPAGRCTACCPGTRTCGWTPRTPSTSRAGAPAAARAEGGRGPAAADQQLHRRRRPRARAGPRRRLRRPTRAALADADLVVLPGTRATHRRPGLAARRAGSTARSSPTPPPGGRCSGSAAAARCSGAPIADPHGVEGPPGAVVDGLGLLDLTTDVRRGEGAAACTSRPATRSTTAG